MDAFTIIGAGGIGCAVGYVLRAGGVGVTFVDADAQKVAWGRRHGVQIAGRPPLPAEFRLFIEWRPTPGDVLLLCTKCYDNVAVLARVPESATLLPIQNGFDAALEARTDAVEGIASFVSECTPYQTHTRITRNGSLHLGGGHPIVPRLADRLRRAPFRVRVVPNIRPYKYTKLLYNAAISPLAAAAGLDNGALLWLPAARRLFFALLRENYAILRGAGVPLGKVGPFHPDTVQQILRRGGLARMLAWAFYPSLRGTYCSMAGDVVKGRTEIENYTGHLLALAGDRPCPLNRAVYALLRRLERERRVPGVAVLDELLDVLKNRAAA
jgi:2-dehydropantoate 2-reductase